MITSAKIQLVRNANPGAVLPGIDTHTGNPLPASSLVNYTTITQNRSERAGPDRLNRIPRRLSGLLPGLVLCNFARGA
jgi:hypothetical protein